MPVEITPGGDRIVHDPLLYYAIARNPIAVHGLPGVERAGPGPSLEELGRMDLDARFRAAMTALVPYVLPLFFGAAGPAYKASVGARVLARDFLPLLGITGGMAVRGVAPRQGTQKGKPSD